MFTVILTNFLMCFAAVNRKVCGPWSMPAVAPEQLSLDSQASLNGDNFLSPNHRLQTVDDKTVHCIIATRLKSTLW
jgi:hypothetical protein